MISTLFSGVISARSPKAAFPNSSCLSPITYTVGTSPNHVVNIKVLAGRLQKKGTRVEAGNLNLTPFRGGGEAQKLTAPSPHPAPRRSSMFPASTVLGGQKSSMRLTIMGGGAFPCAHPPCARP